MYLMHNPRSHKVYGYSHVEQVLVTVNILIRRAMHQLDYYREGSQPDAFVGLPKEWNQEQIVAFQKHFDAMLSGNLGLRRRLRFMPGEFKYQETKPPPLKDMYDDYLARIICFVFSISAEPFISHVNRATAESSQSRAIDEGLAPLMRYVSGIMNRIIACEFASPDLEFVWQDSRVQDPKEAAQIDVAYVQAGIMTVNEVRANMGLTALSPSQLPTPMPVAQKKTSGGLFKDDSGDDDEEDDDEEGEEGSDSDSSDDGSSDFDSKHPRWPAGSPGGIGGEFAPKDEGDATQALHDALAADAEGSSASTAPAPLDPDKVRAAITSALDGTTQLPDGTQVAMGPLIEEAEPLLEEGTAVVEEGITAVEDAIAGGEGSATTASQNAQTVTEGANSVSTINATEIAKIIDKANNTIGNDGEIATSQEVAEQAAEQFVGPNSQAIYDRNNSNVAVGEISADGSRVIRYTSISNKDSYINFENKTTGGNLHVRWSK